MMAARGLREMTGIAVALLWAVAVGGGAQAAPAATAASPVAAYRGDGHDPLAARLAASAPALARAVLDDALRARACAIASGDRIAAQALRLAVIDYALPSTQVRLWLFDLASGRLLLAEHVAHGRGSGEDMATAFSNDDGSHQSSLGLYHGAEPYVGGNGYSLRLDGLEPGINHRARERLIVIHGAPYVDPAQALRQGRLGRSWGCPVVRPAVAREVIDALKDGQLVFVHGADADWRARSRLLDCPAVKRR